MSEITMFHREACSVKRLFNSVVAYLPLLSPPINSTSYADDISVSVPEPCASVPQSQLGDGLKIRGQVTARLSIDPFLVITLQNYLAWKQHRGILEQKANCLTYMLQSISGTSWKLSTECCFTKHLLDRLLPTFCR